MIGRIGLAAALVLVGAVAVVPAAASAGGFSTVGLESAPPNGVGAGKGWEARFTVLAHGRTPMDHLKPVVRIERVDGEGQRTFRATKTSAAGTYRARVAFPAEGSWAVEVAEYDAMAGSPVAGHSFGTVDVGSASEARSSGGPRPLAALVIAVALALLGGGDDDPRAADTGWSDEGRRVFAAMGCGSCHRLAAAGSAGAIGPNLDEALAGHDRESLVHSIVRAPGESLATMPGDYGERMTGAELDALVSFLLASR